AYDPAPRDGAKAVATDVTLSWTAGFGAKMHTVYFGDDFDTVSNASGGPPQALATYTPGDLEKDKVYYWRVDEFNPPETVKGAVWTFRTLPEIVITDPDMIGWWKLDSIHGTTVLDWSGHGNDGTLGGDPQLVEGAVDFGLDLDGSDYVSLDAVADDLTSRDFTVSIWIRTTQSGEGNVIASNTGSSHVFQFGVKGGNVWVDDGPETQFTTANDDQWHMITFVKSGSNGLVYLDGAEIGTISTTIDVTTEARWSIGQEWDSSPSDFYVGMVDDCRFFNKALTPDEVAELMRGDPLVAWNPKPANKTAIDVERAKQPLSWSPGDNASEHDVYLGTDMDAVGLADTSTADIYRGRQAGTSYTVPGGLEWGTGPYFWRVDEINADGSVSSGSIWSFSVADYLSVEDFESYTDDDGANEAIWQHWIDGFGVAGNGSQVGNLLPPYAEKTIVNSGAQSMPLTYENTAGVTNSEAVLTVTAPRDWTIHGVEALSIWFRGYPGSVGSFAEGPVGTYTMTASGADIWGTSDEFHFAYKQLNGVGTIIAKVESVTNTHNWAKAGVMIRETLAPGSPHAFVCVTPAEGVAFQRRVNADGTSSGDTEAGITAPHWVKLERDVAGNFTASRSTNGSTWVPVGAAIPERILMNPSVYIGLAVTSHNTSATCEAVFSSVSTTGQVTGQWISQDIGIATNAAEPLYVSVANAAGAAAVVAHTDPDAATIDVWTEWVIPLQEFADKGINLTNIDKIAIGLGSQSGQPAAGGSGTMYLDDIRLYRLAP
ncbi:MAG: LamG domain-containing protein, partial [Planctomycetota bacterium]